MDKLRELIEPLKDEDDITRCLVRILNQLKLLHLHFEFTLSILNATSDKEISAIKEKFSVIQKDYANLNTKSDLVYYPTQHAVEFILNYLLSEIERAVAQFYQKSDDKDILGPMKNYLLDAYKKMNIDEKYIPKFISQKDDGKEQVVDKSEEKLIEIKVLVTTISK